MTLDVGSNRCGGIDDLEAEHEEQSFVRFGYRGHFLDMFCKKIVVNQKDILRAPDEVMSEERLANIVFDLYRDPA